MSFLKLFLVAVFASILLTACDPDLIDLSPERENGIVDGGISTAGLMLNITGDKKGLYAIGLNSGVWKTELAVAHLRKEAPSGVLPTPFTPVSSVNVNQEGIYVTTEGRGIFKIVNYSGTNIRWWRRNAINSIAF